MTRERTEARPAGPRVWIRTFGCRANQADSEAARALIESTGGSVVENIDEADVALFNSCVVTADAEADLRQGIRRARRDRELPVVVMGCAPGRVGGTWRSLPGIRATIAGAEPTALAAALGLTSVAGNLERRAQAGTRAFLRIQDGCDEHCTFCATTQARGEARSRPVDEIVRESIGSAAFHPEIVLTGIHIGTYGHDLGTTLGALVQRLIQAVPSVRFRLSSVEATEVDDALRECFAMPRHLAPHLHAPLQSASARVLKRMGRHWYTRQSYERSVARLPTHLPFALGADVIAGFPGETDADHRETMAFVRDLPFTGLHVFPFSPREGTAATRLDGAVSPETRRARASELRALAAAKADAYRRRSDGTVADAIVLEGGPRRQALTGDFLDVAVPPALPRGARSSMRLTWDGERLAGAPLAPETP